MEVVENGSGRNNNIMLKEYLEDVENQRMMDFESYI